MFKTYMAFIFTYINRKNLKTICKMRLNKIKDWNAKKLAKLVIESMKQIMIWWIDDVYTIFYRTIM